MARSKRQERRRERARRQLAGKGWTVVLVGLLLLLVVPMFLRGPMLAGLGAALRPAGWAALAIGAVLLALHHFIDRAAKAAGAPEADSASASRARTEPVLDTGAASPLYPRRDAGSQAAATWSAAVFAEIEWRRFEAVCEALYAQAGFATRSQSHGADGGVDIWLQSRHSDQPRIVQCKHWQNRPVGVKELREFLGVMTSHGLKSGTYVTSSRFSSDAIAFAKANRIHVQDGEALLKLIGQRTPAQQAALLEVAYEGEYWRPTCASCGTKMVERHSAKNDGSFWGCANYPRCRGKTIPKAYA